MDRVIEAPPRSKKIVFIWIAFGLFAIFLLIVAIASARGNKIRVAKSAVQIAKVERGVFKDAIPIRFTFEPLKTVFIDTVQGGSVAEIFVEEGAMVNAGETLMRLDNVNFKLQVASQEALIAEQLNTNSSVRLQLDQNRLDLHRRLNDIDYSIVKLEHQLNRSNELFAKKMVAANAIEVLDDEMQYQIKQRELTRANIAFEEKIRGPKMRQLEESAFHLQDHLKNVSKTLDSLWIRSSIKGQLTSFHHDIGEIIPTGNRIGQIDGIGKFKLKAEVDEFYIGRVEAGQKAEFELNGKNYIAKVDKVFPQVNSGKFLINLTFPDNSPPEARPGLRVSAELMLGDSKSGLVLKNGGFFQNTAGKWAYVLNADGSKAVRKPIHVGRVNASSIEINDGLREGEAVIVSSYADWQDKDEVVFDN